MQRANEKYMELRRMGTWGKKPNKDEQYVALNAKIDELVKTKDNSGNGKGAGNEQGDGKSNTPKWKFDRSLSSSNTYERNNKTYHWCEGPGHKPMWVIHTPSSCTKSNKDKNNKTSEKPTITKKSLTAALKAKGEMSDDEIEGKVEAILAMIED